MAGAFVSALMRRGHSSREVQAEQRCQARRERTELRRKGKRKVSATVHLAESGRFQPVTPGRSMIV